MQNPYATSYATPFLIQQRMVSSQLSYNQPVYQTRQHRSSLQANLPLKVVTSSRANAQLQMQNQPQEKQRQISEQKHAQKPEIPNPLFTHSHIVYSNGQKKLNFDQSYHTTPNTSLRPFQDMDIKIKDFPAKIQEEQVDQSITPLKQEHHVKVNQLNQEWTEIIQKTKCLEQNLLILRNSVDQNLMKFNKNKIQNSEQEQLKVNNQLLHNQSVKILKNDNEQQQMNPSEYLDRFSKESNSSKVKQKHSQSIQSTNNQSEKKNSNILDRKLQSQNQNGIISMPIKNKLSQLPQTKYQGNTSFIIKQFGSKNPQTPDLEQVNTYLPKDRNGQQQSNEINQSSNIKKVQMPSRLNSPLQTKLSKETLVQKSKFEELQRNHSVDKQKQNLTLSRINFESPKVNNFTNTSVGWYDGKQRLSPFSGIEIKLKIKVGRFLGRGQFSDVYLARDEISGYLFALKMIRKETVAEFEMEEQIGREIKTQWALDHPNIVKMYGCDYDSKHIYLLLEYCEQGELFQHQNKQDKRRFNEEQAALYVGQILNAIQYMHEKKVMHRDLKTENILLSYVNKLIILFKNQIKLCDLGCVSDFIDRRTTFCGTVDYIAPEVITGYENEVTMGYDQRCDVWQIAILSFELVAGKTPFTDDGPRDEDVIMDNIMKKEVEMPNYFSSDLISFLKGGLQKIPDRRADVTQLLKHNWIVKYQKLNQETLELILKKFDKN